VNDAYLGSCHRRARRLALCVPSSLQRDLEAPLRGGHRGLSRTDELPLHPSRRATRRPRPASTAPRGGATLAAEIGPRAAAWPRERRRAWRDAEVRARHRAARASRAAAAPMLGRRKRTRKDVRRLLVCVPPRPHGRCVHPSTAARSAAAVRPSTWPVAPAPRVGANAGLAALGMPVGRGGGGGDDVAASALPTAGRCCGSGRRSGRTDLRSSEIGHHVGSSRAAIGSMDWRIHCHCQGHRGPAGLRTCFNAHILLIPQFCPQHLERLLGTVQFLEPVHHWSRSAAKHISEVSHWL